MGKGSWLEEQPGESHQLEWLGTEQGVHPFGVREWNPGPGRSVTWRLPYPRPCAAT